MNKKRLTTRLGLKVHKELFVYNVTIQIQGKLYKIHTYSCGDDNLESIVLIHGYSGASFLYYQMLKDLSKKFRVYCMDIVGMGLSSRDEFECKTTDETLEFLMESIEKWREAVGLTRFYLVGHSLGGYLSGHYTVRYQQHVIRLILLSAVGVTKYSKEPTPQDLKKRLGFFRNLFHGIVVKAWKTNRTPNKFVREHGTFKLTANKFMNFIEIYEFQCISMKYYKNYFII